MLERVEKTLKPVGMSSGTCGGASLQQQGVAHVAHSHRPWIRRQGQLVTGAAVAVDVSAVSAVVLRMQNIQRDVATFMWLRTLTEAALKWNVMGVGGTYLSAWDWELLLALFALSGFIIFQPSVALRRAMVSHSKSYSVNNKSKPPSTLSHFTFRALLTSLKSSIFSLDLWERWKWHKFSYVKWHSLVRKRKKNIAVTDWLRCSPISCRACSCCSHFCCSCCFSCFNSCSSCKVDP